MDLDADSQPRRRPSGCWVLAAALVLLGVALIAALYGWDMVLKRKLAARVAEAHAQGQPVTFDEFMERRRQAGPVDCSALAFLDAFQRWQQAGEDDAARAGVIELLGFPDDLGARRSGEQRAMMRQEVESCAEALALMHEGSRLPVGSYPVDASGPPWLIRMDYLAAFRGAARLCRRAAVLRAEEGDGRAAAESTEDCLALAASVGKWPMLIELLVGMVVQSIALDGLERGLGLCEMPPESLDTLRESLRKTEAGNPGEAVLLAERASGYYSLAQAPADELVGLLRGEGGVPAIVARLYVMVPAWRTGDALFYYDLFDRQVALQSLPLEERLRAAGQVNRQTEADVAGSGMLRHPLTAMLMPALGRVCEEEGKAVARARTARAGLAAEQWRMAHGSWPDSLDQLVPEVLEAVPSDPFTGKPLLYHRTEQGVIVYSVGPDGGDNAGLRQEDAPDLAGTGTPPYDIPFRLVDVERRGARTATFRDEVMAAGWLSLQKLKPFGFDEARLRELGFTADDLRRLHSRD